MREMNAIKFEFRIHKARLAWEVGRIEFERCNRLL